MRPKTSEIALKASVMQMKARNIKLLGETALTRGIIIVAKLKKIED